MPALDRLSRPLRDLRISVTDRCNLRCSYCMPSEIYDHEKPYVKRSKVLRFEEIERLVRIFVEFGVRKLRITGGEPLLRRELPVLIEKLAAIEGVEDVALTTNGLLLAPQAEALAAAGLRRVTVSLDSLDSQLLSRIAGRECSVETVLAALDVAAAAGLGPIKINCVVQRGVNDHEILPMAEHFRGSGHILRFIEYMDVGTSNGWTKEQVLPTVRVRELVESRHALEALEPNEPGEVASRFRYVDGGGEIGFISSVTQPFCGGCQRARLTTDGRAFTCLFAEKAHDLRTPLRTGVSDSHLRQLIESIWSGRADRYSELRSVGQAGRRRPEMYELGG